MGSSVNPSPLSKKFATILGVMALYTLSGKLGLELAFVNPSATAVWPPTGIALVAFLVLGYRVWPAIALSAFVVNLTTSGKVAPSVGIAIGNTLEGVVGAYLARRFANGCRAFDRAHDVFTFGALAGGVSTIVSATIGVATLCFHGLALWSRYTPIWLTWWLGDMAGDLVVAPLLLQWSTAGAWRVTRRGMIERAAFLAGLLLTGQIVFGALLPFGTKNYPLDFLCIPFLAWAAFRFTSQETATAIFLLSGISVWGTLRGFGPFVRSTPNESLLLLQGFMAVIALMTLGVSAVVGERKGDRELLVKANEELEVRVAERTGELEERVRELRRAEVALRESEKSLLELSGQLLRVQDEERRRLARELHDSSAQTLAGLKMNLSVVKAASDTLDPASAKALSDAIDLSTEVVEELRTLSYLLFPPMLDHAGLAFAVHWYVEGFTQRSGVKVDLAMPPELRRLPQEIETALFRILQESLSNVHRHSTSKAAQVQISVNADEITLDVRDRGRGIPLGALEKGVELGVGIRGMRERVRQLGGKMEINCGSGGTWVRVSLPVLSAGFSSPIGQS